MVHSFADDHLVGVCLRTAQETQPGREKSVLVANTYWPDSWKHRNDSEVFPNRVASDMATI